MSDIDTSSGAMPHKEATQINHPDSSGINPRPTILRKASALPLRTKNGVPSIPPRRSFNISTISPSQYASSQKKDTCECSLRMSKKEFRGIMLRTLLCLLGSFVLAGMALVTTIAGVKIMGAACVILAAILLWFAHPLTLMEAYAKRIQDSCLSTQVKGVLIALPWITYVAMGLVCIHEDERLVDSILMVGFVVIIICFVIACFMDGDPEKNGWGEPPNH